MSASSVNAFMQLDENAQRQALASMSPEAKQALLAGMSAHKGTVPPPPSTVSGIYADIAAKQRAAAQQKSYEAFGPEAQGKPLLSRIGAGLSSLGHEATGVAGSIESALTDPKQATIAATGLFDPAIPAAYFGTQAAAGLTGIGQPSSVAQAVRSPTPENVQGALLQGATLAGAGAGAGSPRAGSTVEAIGASSVTQRLAQEALNVGPKFVERTAAKIQSYNDAAIAAYNEKLANFKNKLDVQKSMEAADFERHKANVAETQRQNAADLAEHQQTVKELMAINDARQAAYEAAKEGQAQRAQLVNDVTNNGATIATQTKALETAVRNNGNAKFQAVGEAIGDRPASPEVLRSAVAHAEKNIIKGSPENIKIFRDILNETSPEGGQPVSIGGENLPVTHPLYQQLLQEGALTAPSPIGYPTLQGWYSELGYKMGTRNLPGDVYHALKYVRNAGVGGEMMRLAKDAGVDKDLAGARAYWHGYENTFNDMRPVAQGGSPVARAFRAVDPDYAVAAVTGKSGLRAVQQIETYDPELANVIRQTISKSRQMQSIPKTMPTAPALRQIPKPPAPREMPTPPKLKPSPEAPEIPALKTLDPQAARTEAVQKIADYLRGEGGWRIWSDVLAGEETIRAASHGNIPAAVGFAAFPVVRRLVGAGMERPSFLKWISSTPQDSGIASAPRGRPSLFPAPPPPSTALPQTSPDLQ